MRDEGTVKLVPCPKCKGQPKPDCDLCHGSGVVLPGK